MKELTPPRAATLQREMGGVRVHTQFLYVEEGCQSVYVCFWVCVCVCEKESEREGEREREHGYDIRRYL